MNQNLLVSFFALLVIGGGMIARAKGDYFSRGIAITFITSIFGIIAMILSPHSKARIKDEHDIHQWPAHGYLAVLGQLLLGIILLILH